MSRNELMKNFVVASVVYQSRSPDNAVTTKLNSAMTCHRLDFVFVGVKYNLNTLRLGCVWFSIQLLFLHTRYHVTDSKQSKSGY